jgi:hypothetical protein
MNMKQLEQLLVNVKAWMGEGFTFDEKHNIDRAIKYVQARQRSAHRRSAHFKFLADERREMLR